MAENSFFRNVLIAVRFIVFGVFGFVVMIFAFVRLVDQLTSVRHANGYLVPLGLIAVSGVGAVMMLFGVGEWGRWGYLLFFSRFRFPYCCCSYFRMPEKRPVLLFQRLHRSARTSSCEFIMHDEKGQNLLPRLIKLKEIYLKS